MNLLEYVSNKTWGILKVKRYIVHLKFKVSWAPFLFAKSGNPIYCVLPQIDLNVVSTFITIKLKFSAFCAF